MKDSELRVAYFSPLLPQRSGIADYSRELLPYLAELMQITAFSAGSQHSDNAILQPISTAIFDEYNALRHDFDLALYHMGNSEYHDEIARLALAYPGVLVLHDYVLHHSVAQRTIGQGNKFAYWREMGYGSGAAGVRQADALAHGYEPPLFEVPLNRRMLDASLGVIVHSKYAARLVRRQGYGGPLAIIPAGIEPIDGQSRRAQLGLSERSVLFASYGLITQEKQIFNVLHALRKLREEMPEVHYLLVGQSMPDLPVAEYILELGLQDVVHLVGYVPQLSDFVDWIHTADVVINLRNPTVGETSATALRAMAASRPLIVCDHGWYSEIPAEAAIKIPPGDDQALLAAMRQLGQSQTLRGQLGLAGQIYTGEICHPKVAAARYLETLQNIQRSVRIYG